VNYKNFYLNKITRRTMNNQKQMIAMLASYGRSLLAAGIALYAAGVTDPTQLANALWAALLPVIIRYVNPNDPAFGRMPSAEEVEQAARTAKKPTTNK
jgi:hypothetical protein